MKIETEIINVLNQPDCEINKIKNELSSVWKRRRGENRKLVDCVIRLLDYYRLPIRNDEEITIKLEEYITERNIELLKSILTQSKHPLFNALCAEVLWNYKRDRELGEIALMNYDSLSNDKEYSEHFPQIYLSVCRMYSKYHSKTYDFESFACRTLDYVRSRLSEPDFTNAFILLELSKSKLYCSEIKDIFLEIINNFENENDFTRANGYIEDLLEIKELTSQQEKQELMVRIANNYEKQANQYDWKNAGNAHSIIFCIHSAMNWWEKSKSPLQKDERKRLSKSIEEVKKLSLTTMQTISSGEIDIHEWMDNRREFIENSNIATVVLGLVELVELIDEESAYSSFIESGSVVTQFFSTNILDSSGRTKCIVPPLSDDPKERLAFLEFQAKKTYDFYSGFVYRYLSMAREKFSFKDNELEFLFENNIIIQPDRIESFKQGIIKGFEGNYVVSLHLLMPQIEHALRCLAEDCGAVVYKTNSQGVEECLSLESILNCPEICESIDETLLFNLRLFYTSPCGYGMRNEISHGLLSDNELNLSVGLMVWWFTLKLCCLFAPPYHEYYLKKANKKID